MKHLILFFLAVGALASCNSNRENPRDDTAPVQTVREEENIIHRLPRLHVLDTCRVGSNIYTWEIDRLAYDSLGIVEDDMGFRYADNSVKLVVKRNGSALYSRTFVKKDFSHLLSRDFLSKSILDGCRFLQVQNGMITFSMAVSYPESDMSQPFKLNIATDGSASLLKSDEMEEAYPADSVLNRN